VKDVVIVGSGAGGGPLALVCAQAGLEVLVLEKGPRCSRQAYAREGGIPPGDFTPSIQEDPHTVVTRQTTTPLLTDFGWIATCVGGGTVHMGGYFYRFHPDDFRMRSRFGEYAENADWPYTYEELEPYYTRAEWEIGVSGGSVTNPFDGPRSKGYPMPPLDAHPIAERLDGICRERGLHPYPTPRSINSREYRGRPACAYCEACASYGCPVGARGSSQEALLSRAEATGRCEVRPGSMVREITVGRDGRATGCVVLDEAGEEHEVRGRVVCVCCSAIESARLLLLSRSSRFPDGLANRSGKVGRHLQFHGVTMGFADLPRSRLSPEEISSHPMLGRSLMDYYFLPEGVSDLPKGGLLRFGRSLQDPAILEAMRRAGLPAPAREDDGFLGLSFEVFHDFLPNAHTFVELDPEVKDKWGLPVARIHLDRPKHLVHAGRWVLERAAEIFAQLGAEKVVPTDVGGISSYLVHGTCRAGRDPETSVVDAYCRTHDVPNLYVVDGSFMPTSGGAAPTLTILANSFRTAEHLVCRFRAGDVAG